MLAAPPPDNFTVAPRKAKLNGCQMGCLVVFGLFAALILLGSLVGGGSRGSTGVEGNGLAAQADRDRFKQVLESSGAGGVVLSIARGIGENDVRITVGSPWFYEPYQMRLQCAQSFQRAWASIHSPNNPDSASISLVDGNGNSVGGSGMFGSMVNVDR